MTDDGIHIPHTADCAATSLENITFTRKQLEEYGEWKKKWLEEQGKTEEQYEAELATLGKWLGYG